MEKQTQGQADCKRKEQDAGVPLLLHNRKCHRHHQNGRGQGRFPCLLKGTGEEESTSSVQPKEVAGMAEWRQGVGGLLSPQPTPSEVSFLSNEGSGGLAGLIGGSGFFSALGI